MKINSKQAAPKNQYLPITLELVLETKEEAEWLRDVVGEKTAGPGGVGVKTYDALVNFIGSKYPSRS